MQKLAEDNCYDRIKALDIVNATEKQIPEGSAFDFIPKIMMRVLLPLISPRHNNCFHYYKILKNSFLIYVYYMNI